MTWVYVLAGFAFMSLALGLYMLADWLGDRRAERRGDVGETAEPSRAWLKGPLGPW
jgi:hypothetical protein